MTRANPLGDLDDFQVGATRKPVEHAQIDKLARAANFPSRKAVMPADPDATPADPSPATAAPPAAAAPVPAPNELSDLRARARTRRYTTGRNQQVNIKATAETIERLYRVADEMGMPFGEVLEHALTALETSRGAQRRAGK